MVSRQQRAEGRHLASMPPAPEEAPPGCCRERRSKERDIRKWPWRGSVRYSCYSLLSLAVLLVHTWHLTCLFIALSEFTDR